MDLDKYGKIAVVVVTYNRKEHLRVTLQRLLGEGVAPSDIIVMNNASDDGTEKMLADEFAGVQVNHLQENIASAGGFSLGMRQAHQAGYDWVLLFNDDSRPMAGSLQLAVDCLKDPKIGILKIANTNEKGEAILLNWKGVRVPKYVPVSDQPVRTDLITFDGCFISERVMDVIGYCDPKYFMGTYEFDYCLKAKEAGLGIFTLPNGKIEDDKLGSVKGTPPWRQYYNTRNHLWLALHTRSFQTFSAWFKRELKYTGAILWKGDRKKERLLFKFRAIRDAVLGRRGKVYLPTR